VSREGRARHGDLPAYGGEQWLERELRKILADYDRKLPGRLVYYHTHRSEHSPSGFPDWVFAGPGGVLFAELKGPVTKLSAAQVQWFDMLNRARARVELWRPDDLRSGLIGAKLRYLAGLGIAERDRLGLPDARNTATPDED
jgi:hypothetical protein